MSGKRAERLRALLLREGLRLAPAKLKAPRMADLSTSSADHIGVLFREFGGMGVAERLRPGPWDFELASGVVVELDEQSHFTRYRGRTLQDAFSDGLPWASTYRGLCRTQEAHALRHGGYWRNPSTDAMFGPSDAPGTFMGLGSSRWKQRAVYDAVKDAAAHDGLIRLARVSIYDVLAGVQLGRVLEGNGALEPGVLAAWIASRTLGAPGKGSAAEPSAASRLG
ncbi:DUF7255 family protein [Agrococcus beijingensis]|uniref:DUF7255 family protein n=1 Tax=Agrococcus beijingensis TaxID=3068634 RepID=UPI002742224C|nr:hypothetical protein [Agrococcus sp. REN33]